MGPVRDPVTGQIVPGAGVEPMRSFTPEGVLSLAPQGAARARVGRPGAWQDHVFASTAEAHAYAAERAQAGEAVIRDQSALPLGWPPENGQVFPGNPVDAMGVYPVPENTPTMTSTVAPQPESYAATPGTPRSYPGGGPQTQLSLRRGPPTRRSRATPFLERVSEAPPAGPVRVSTGGTATGDGHPHPPASLGDSPGPDRVARPVPVAAAGTATPRRRTATPSAAGSRVSSRAACRERWVARTPVPSSASSTAVRSGRASEPGSAPSSAGCRARSRASGPPAAQRPGVTIDPRTGGGAELVNPRYKNPPGTPQQIAAIRTEIARIDAEHAQTQAARNRVAAQAQQAQQLSQAAGQARQGAEAGAGTATATHQEGDDARRHQPAGTEPADPGADQR